MSMTDRHPRIFTALHYIFHTNALESGNSAEVDLTGNIHISLHDIVSWIDLIEMLKHEEFHKALYEGGIADSQHHNAMQVTDIDFK